MRKTYTILVFRPMRFVWCHLQEWYENKHTANTKILVMSTTPIIS